MFEKFDVARTACKRRKHTCNWLVYRNSLAEKLHFIDKLHQIDIIFEYFIYNSSLLLM